MDQTFERNIQGASDAGLEMGVYFFSQAITPEEAEAEAAYIINALEGCDITYPVAFDWEPIAPDKGARTNELDGETLTRCASAFCKKIQEAGYTPAVYFNQSLGYLRYDLRELTDYCLWLAEYDTKPDFYYHFDLWQYSHTGIWTCGDRRELRHAAAKCSGVPSPKRRARRYALKGQNFCPDVIGQLLHQVEVHIGVIVRFQIVVHGLGLGQGIHRLIH